MESRYDATDYVNEQVRNGRHRGVVGGSWEEMGQRQLDFLISHGLSADDRLIDVGCGSLRAGVKLIPFLRPGHYWGIDSNPSLLDAGWEHELGPLGLQERQPREQLVMLDDFQFEQLGQTFDVALAQSLFTHFSWNRIRRCLARLAAVVRPGGRLFATFFEVPSGQDPELPIRQQPGGIETYSDRNPYHYRFEDIELALRHLPWRAEYLGDWEHPRGQKMLAFERGGSRLDESAVTRALGVDEAAGLRAGSHHYRAFVGPPARFDFLSASQFALLFALGLNDRHRVLDFGCGSLRLGRLLIPFLRERGYFGIEPERWLIEDGLSRELGHDAVRIKHPSFSHDPTFNCGVFGKRFDFIVAQSIVSHTGPDLARKLIGTAAAALKPSGLMILSYQRNDSAVPEWPADGWHYGTGCVGYTEEQMLGLLAEGGLHACAIPWHHPTLTWLVAATQPDRLPKPRHRRWLRGRALHDPRFVQSAKRRAD